MNRSSCRSSSNKQETRSKGFTHQNKKNTTSRVYLLLTATYSQSFKVKNSYKYPTLKEIQLQQSLLLTVTYLQSLLCNTGIYLQTLLCNTGTYLQAYSLWHSNIFTATHVSLLQSLLWTYLQSLLCNTVTYLQSLLCNTNIFQSLLCNIRHMSLSCNTTQSLLCNWTYLQSLLS